MSNNLPQPSSPPRQPSPRPPSYRPLPPPRDDASPHPPPYALRLSMPPPYVRGEQPPLPPTPTAPPVPPRPRIPRSPSAEKELPLLPIVEAPPREAPARSLPSTPELTPVHERPLPALPNEVPAPQGRKKPTPPSPEHPRPLPPLPNRGLVLERPLPSTPGEDPETRPLPAPPRDAGELCLKGVDNTPPLPPLPGARERVPPPFSRVGVRRYSCESEEGRGRRMGGLKGGGGRRGVSGSVLDEGERRRGEGGALVRRHSTGRRGDAVFEGVVEFYGGFGV